MKKILAIAVATAIAAPAMADMTIGGTYAFGYTETAGTSGFGTDTAAISVSGSGEVMDGVSVKAGISAGGMTRGASAVTGENAYMSLSGDFGTAYMGEVEAGSGIRSLGQAGAPVNTMEGEILGAAGNVTLIKYTAPAFGNVVADVSYAQATGMGAGEDAGSYGIGATATFGIVKVRADYTDWEKNAANTQRTRLSAQLDLGALKVGAGTETRGYKATSAVTAVAYGFDATGAVTGTTAVAAKAAYDRTNTIVGASYALSDATTVGAVVVSTDSETAATDLSGYSVGFAHNLGGNVSLSANYSDWETSQTAKEQKTNVILAYSF
jgi:hypothetical protein